MSNKNNKNFWKCRSVKYVFLTDRDNKKRKKETTDEQIDEQKEDIKRWRMHVKSEKLKSFFDTKGNCCHKEWVQEEGDQENKRSNKRGNEKRGECETWWTKTRSDEKRDGRKTCKKEKHKKNIRKRFSFFQIRKSSWKKEGWKGDKTNP